MRARGGDGRRAVACGCAAAGRNAPLLATVFWLFANAHSVTLDFHFFILNFDGRISLGVIDQRIDNIETEEDINNAIKPALEYFPKERILLTSECGFGHVPIDIVRNKVKILVSTAKKL